MEEPVLVYTDASGVDAGSVGDFELDMEFGTDALPCDFEATFAGPRLKGGELVYIDATEYGGVVDQVETLSTSEAATYRGRTWHGVLACKVISPDSGKDYYTLSGDLNACIRTVVSRLGLTGLFRGRAGSCGISVTNYQFERYVDAYKGLCALCASKGAVLRMAHAADTSGGRVELWAEARRTAGDDECDSDVMEVGITENHRVVNHLVCLGEGELKDRVVVHLYADAKGNVSQRQSLFGVDEVAEVYDYSGADREALVERGTERLKEYQVAGSATADAVDAASYDWHVGDLLSAADMAHNREVTAPVVGKVVKVSAGVLTVDYEVGDATGAVGSVMGPSATAAGKSAQEAAALAQQALTDAYRAGSLAAGASSKVDGLEVGGTNLCATSKAGATFPHTVNGITVERDGDGFHVHGTNTKTDAAYDAGNLCSMHGVIEPDTRYTLSVYPSLPTGTYVRANTLRNGIGANIAIVSSPATHNTGDSGDCSNGALAVFLGIRPTVCEVDFRFKVKLEKGNVATDWSPAPLDQDATYATKAALSVESDRITGVVSEQAGLAGRVSTVEQKSDSFTVSLGQTNANVSSLQTGLNTANTNVANLRNDHNLIKDPDNLCQLNRYTATRWGFTTREDGNNDTLIYTVATVRRDKLISMPFSVEPGDRIRAHYYVRSTVQGPFTNGGTDVGYRKVRLGLKVTDGLGANPKWVFFDDSFAGSAGQPWVEVDGTLAVPHRTGSMAGEYSQAQLMVQADGWSPFTGSYELTQISVTRAGAVQGMAEDAQTTADSALTAAEASADMAQSAATNSADAIAQTNAAVAANTSILDSFSVDELNQVLARVRVVQAGGVPALQLGSTTSGLWAQLTNSQLSFMDASTVVAYISAMKLFISQAQVTGQLGIGGFAWVPRANGNLCLKKV